MIDPTSGYEFSMPYVADNAALVETVSKAVGDICSEIDYYKTCIYASAILEFCKLAVQHCEGKSIDPMQFFAHYTIIKRKFGARHPVSNVMTLVDKIAKTLISMTPIVTGASTLGR